MSEMPKSRERYPCPALLLQPSVWLPGWDDEHGNLEYCGTPASTMFNWRSSHLGKRDLTPDLELLAASGTRHVSKLRLRHDAPGMASELAAWVYFNAASLRKPVLSYEVSVSLRADTLRVHGPHKTVTLIRDSGPSVRLPALSRDVRARVSVPELTLLEVPYALAQAVRAIVCGQALIEKAVVRRAAAR